MSFIILLTIEMSRCDKTLFLTINQKDIMPNRIRLNQEYRNKIANRMRVHLEQEDTQEKEKFFQAREEI